MPRQQVRDELIDKLQTDIAAEVGNQTDNDLETISTSFDKSLATALHAFNSSTFDNDGFIKKIRDLDIDGSKDVVKNVLNTVRSDYITVESVNQSELLLRRDLDNICVQMPEMRDVIMVIRDAIIECNVATGEVSRTISFENVTEDQDLMAQVDSIEKRHDIMRAIKNFIVPNTLKTGEMYVQVLPYSKLFAELEAMRDTKIGGKRSLAFPESTEFKESCPRGLLELFNHTPKSLYTEDNLKVLLESASHITKEEAADSKKIDADSTATNAQSAESINRKDLKFLLEHIDVYSGSSTLMSELGPEGCSEFILKQYLESKRSIDTDNGKKKDPKDPAAHFMEVMDFNAINQAGFDRIDQDNVDIGNYKDIKGCYIKYLDSLRMVPIRVDRRIVGYYYISTTMDLQNSPAQPNGLIDLSFQNYMRDKNMVDQLAQMIIKSFDKKMLERNIKLKDEIAEIIMAHKFSEGKLSFIYIPEPEVIRFAVNEDEEGRGHSVIEPTLFPARMYLMLTLYNMLYTLNNNTTRIHYLRSSGLNKNYAAQIQRAMRKFQSRRITIDDIFSFSGVLNKVGGMGEMVLPSGRSDFKALETDTIEAVPNPINMEFLEQQRRQAVSGTGVPHLMMINAIDEADFAKSLEMANSRFLSTVSSYKIDFNRDITKYYQRILHCDTDMEADNIQAFRFQFNPAKQQEMVITSDMINTFNTMVEAVEAAYYDKSELEDDKGNPTPTRKILKRKLAEKYLAQLDFDYLDKLVDEVNLAARDEQLQKKVDQNRIDKDDMEEMES